METAAQVLLIIVSSVVAVFLVILSIALLFLIKFLRKADNVADSVGSAATAFRRGMSAMPVIKILTGLVKARKRR